MMTVFTGDTKHHVFLKTMYGNIEIKKIDFSFLLKTKKKIDFERKKAKHDFSCPKYLIARIRMASFKAIGPQNGK